MRQQPSSTSPDVSPDVADFSFLSRGMAPEERAVFLLPTDKHIFATILLVFSPPALPHLLLPFRPFSSLMRLVIVCDMSNFVETMRNDWRQVYSPEYKERSCCSRRRKRVCRLFDDLSPITRKKL